MKRVNFILLVIAFLATGHSCSSQENADKEKAAEWINSKYPDVEDIEFEIDDHGYLEASFSSDGNEYRADFQLSGEWIETEESIDWDDLPEAVQDAIQEEFDKDDIAEIEHVEHHEKGLFYDVEFKDPGKNVDIEFREDGSRV